MLLHQHKSRVTTMITTLPLSSSSWSSSSSQAASAKASHDRHNRGILNIIILTICSLIFIGGAITFIAWALSDQSTPPHDQALLGINMASENIQLKPPMASHHPLMRELSVMIGLIGRNVAQELVFVLPNVERLSEKFKRAHVVLVENDSEDATVATFKDWGFKFKASSSGTASSHLISFNGGFRRKSIDGLAIARNKYIDAFVAANDKGDAYDYLIAVDTDMCRWEIGHISNAIEALLPAERYTRNKPLCLKALSYGMCCWQTVHVSVGCM